MVNKFHNLGGLIVLHYLVSHPSNVRGAITSGPSTIVEAGTLTKFVLLLINSILPKRRVRLPIKPEYLTHDESIVKSYVSDP